ncbi:hypothetical protein NORO109296_03895 [Nocardiopsis rhodophaea]
MRRIPGKEDTALAEAVRQGRPRTEVRGPPHLGHVLGRDVGPGGDAHAHAVEGQVHRGAFGELRHELEVGRARERADRHEALALPARWEDMPVAAVQAGDADVGHQHRVRVDRLAGHADTQRPAHRRAAPVGGDHIGGPHIGTVGEARGRPVGVLRQADDLPAEGDAPAELFQPRQQDLLRTPLRHHPRFGGRRVLCRLGRIEHPVLAHALPVLPDHPDRVGAPGGADRLTDAEVVEDLHGARLDPLAARAGEQRVGPLDDERLHPAPGEVDAQRQTAGTRAHDQYLHLCHHAPTLLNAIKLSRLRRCT